MEVIINDVADEVLKKVFIFSKINIKNIWNQ